MRVLTGLPEPEDPFDPDEPLPEVEPPEREPLVRVATGAPAGAEPEEPAELPEDAREPLVRVAIALEPVGEKPEPLLPDPLRRVPLAPVLTDPLKAVPRAPPAPLATPTREPGGGPGCS